MTHNTDCEVLDEFEAELQELAREVIQSGRGRVPTEVHNRLTDEFGWEFINSGVSRSAYRVPSSEQEGPQDSVTREAPCVVKLATPGRGFYDGRDQNRKEVHNFESLPRHLTRTADPPLFVPLSDWDTRDYLWISVPEVNPSGGWAGEMENRLFDAGYSCDDLHGDNVGDIHGESIILDYGFDCFPITQPADMAREFSNMLEQIGARSVVVHEDAEGADVEFLPPLGLPGGEPVKSSSSATIERFRGEAGIMAAHYYFGTWDAEVDDVDEIRASFDRVIDAAASFNQDAFINVIEYSDGDVEVEYNIEYHDPTPPDIGASEYSAIIKAVEDEAPQGVDPVSPQQKRLDDIRKEINRSIETATRSR